MTQTITWQQRNTIKFIEIIHQGYSMQHNYIKTTSNGRIIPHTLVLQAENCKDAIGEYGQPMIDLGTALERLPSTFSHTKENGSVGVC